MRAFGAIDRTTVSIILEHGRTLPGDVCDRRPHRNRPGERQGDHLLIVPGLRPIVHVAWRAIGPRPSRPSGNTRAATRDLAFFVPGIWEWYAHMDPAAPELVIAVRAINVFFSLLLVLLGVANILIAFRTGHVRYSTVIVYSISTVLWAVRSVL